MNDLLPDRVNVRRLASRAAKLTGICPIGGCKRLLAVVSGTVGDAQVSLSFSIDGQHRALMHCTVIATVEMPCQRCLEPMSVELVAEAVLALVITEEQAANLPAGYEPLLAKDDMVELASVVEDELLLVLPLAPSHDTEGCSRTESEPESPLEDKPNPFAVLETLKRK